MRKCQDKYKGAGISRAIFMYRALKYLHCDKNHGKIFYWAVLLHGQVSGRFYVV